MSRPSAARTHPRGLVRGLSRAAVVRPGAALGTGEGALCVLEGSQLSLTAQRLTSLPALTGKRYGGQAIVTYMRALDASVNALTHVEHLQDFKKLAHVTLDYNELTAQAFGGLRLQRLENLSLNHNRINDLELFLGHLASAAPALKALSLVGNPCVPNVLNAPKQHANYRFYVLSKLPRLRVLDGQPVTQSELERIRGKQIEAPLPLPVLRELSPLDKEELGFAVAHEGALTFSKHRVRSPFVWAPDYFVLGERRLMRYASKHDAEALVAPLSVLALVDYHVAPHTGSDVSEGYSAFSLFRPREDGVTTKSYYFVAQGPLQSQEWMHAFAIQLVDKLEVPFSPRENDADEDDIDSMQWASAEDYHEAKAQRSLKDAQRRVDELQGCRIPSADITLGPVLGKGAFGEVYKARDEGRCRGKACAVKRLHEQQLTDEALADFAAEVEILSKIHHPHILSCFGACTEPQNLMIVTELMAADLLALIRAPNAAELLPLTRVLRMCKDAALGIAWLHGLDPMIIHRDIKPSNFLLDEHFRVVVADLGLSEGVTKGSSTWDEAGAFKGTVTYTAPEILKHSEFDERSDVYSFGVVLYSALALVDEPFPELAGLSNDDFITRIVWEQHRPATDGLDGDVVSLLERCWDADAKARPTMAEVIDLLDALILCKSIPDTLGRAFWQDAFGDKAKVRYSDFVSRWEELVGVTASVLDKALFCGVSALERAAVDPWVSMDRFGFVLTIAGPLERNDSARQRLESLVRSPWCHGDLSADAAAARLLVQPPGTFLIRFSRSHPGSLSLVYVDATCAVRHKLIQKELLQLGSGKKTPFYLIPIAKDNNAQYSSLEELIESQKELRTPCPASEYSVLIAMLDQAATSIPEATIEKAQLRFPVQPRRPRSGSFIYDKAPSLTLSKALSPRGKEQREIDACSEVDESDSETEDKGE